MLQLFLTTKQGEMGEIGGGGGGDEYTLSLICLAALSGLAGAVGQTVVAPCSLQASHRLRAHTHCKGRDAVWSEQVQLYCTGVEQIVRRMLKALAQYHGRFEHVFPLR